MACSPQRSKLPIAGVVGFPSLGGVGHGKGLFLARSGNIFGGRPVWLADSLDVTGG